MFFWIQIVGRIRFSTFRLLFEIMFNFLDWCFVLRSMLFNLNFIRYLLTWFLFPLTWVFFWTGFLSSMLPVSFLFYWLKRDLSRFLLLRFSNSWLFINNLNWLRFLFYLDYIWFPMTWFEIRRRCSLNVLLFTTTVMVIMSLLISTMSIFLMSLDRAFTRWAWGVVDILVFWLVITHFFVTTLLPFLFFI